MNNLVSKITLTLVFVITPFYIQAQVENKLSYTFNAELHYNDFIEQGSNNLAAKSELDLHKASLKAGYIIDKHWSIGSKVIVEHAFDQTYNGGDVYFSNFYTKYKFNKKLNIQAGLINVPLCSGKLSTYGTVEVSPVEKYMSISWRELGVSVNGTPSKKVSYKAMISTGLNPAELNSKTVVYNARNSDLSESLNNVALGGQFRFSPTYNWTIGTALFYSALSNSSNSTADLGSAAYRVFEFYTQYVNGPLETRFVGVYSSISESEKINKTFNSKIGSAQYGTLFEVGYDFSEMFHLNREESAIKGFLRAESYDAHFKTVDIKDNPKYEHTDYSIGLVFQPVKSFELKTDYVLQRSGASTNQHFLNFAVGFNF